MNQCTAELQWFIDWVLHIFEEAKTLGRFSELRGPKCATFVENVGQLSLFSIQYTGWLKKSKLLYCVNSLLFFEPPCMLPLRCNSTATKVQNRDQILPYTLGKASEMHKRNMYDYHTQLKLNLWYTFGRDVKVCRSRDQFWWSRSWSWSRSFWSRSQEALRSDVSEALFYLPFSVVGAVNTVWLFIRFVVLPLRYLDKVELTGRDNVTAESPSAEFGYQCEYFDHDYEFTITPILYSNCNRALVHVVALLTCSVNARCSCCWCHDGASDCQVDICSSMLNSGNVFTKSLSFCILAAQEGR